MPAVTIGTLTFPTKAAALDWCREQRDAGAPDQENLRALLAMHPHATELSSRGVVAIVVRPGAFASSPGGFAVLTDDGDQVWFSFPKCLTPRSARQHLRAALRNEIHPQTLAFRNGRTGEVDHVAPMTFAFLADTWLATQEGDIPLRAAGQWGEVLADPAQSLSWRTFHFDHAVLELVTRAEHRARTLALPGQRGASA